MALPRTARAAPWNDLTLLSSSCGMAVSFSQLPLPQRTRLSRLWEPGLEFLPPKKSNTSVCRGTCKLRLLLTVADVSGRPAGASSFPHHPGGSKATARGKSSAPAEALAGEKEAVTGSWSGHVSLLRQEQACLKNDNIVEMSPLGTEGSLLREGAELSLSENNAWLGMESPERTNAEVGTSARSSSEYARGPLVDEDEMESARRGGASLYEGQGKGRNGMADESNVHTRQGSQTGKRTSKRKGRTYRGHNGGPRRPGWLPIGEALAAIRKAKDPREVGAALEAVVGESIAAGFLYRLVRVLGTSEWARALALTRWSAGLDGDGKVRVVLDLAEAKEGEAPLSTEQLVVSRTGGDCAAAGLDPKLFVATLQLLGRAGEVDEAVKLTADLQKVHPSAVDVFVRTTTMSVLIRAKRYDEALQLFEGMRNDDTCRPTLVTYNVAVDASCKKDPRGQLAETLFMEMKAAGVQPDLCTYNTLMATLSRAGKWKTVERIFSEMREEAKIAPDSISYSALIGAFSRAGQHERSEALAREMRNAGCTLQSVIAWNNLISSQGRAGRHEEAELLIAEMEAQGLAPDAMTFGALLAAYARGGRHEEAEAVHGRMLAAGQAPNRVTWNTLVMMYARLKKLDRMMQCLDEMQDSGLRTDVVTWNTVLDAYAKANMFSEIASAFRSMKRAGVKPDLTTYTILIDAYGRSGSTKDAASMFEGMLRSGLGPSLPAFNSLLGAHARAGEWEAAREVFGRMAAEGLEPDEVSFSSLLHAYANGEQYELVTELAEEIQARAQSESEGPALDRGPVLGQILWKTLVLVFCKCGMAKEAEAALEAMVSQGHPADVQTYNAMITLQRRRSPSGTQLSIDSATRYLEQMEAHGISPDLMTYNCLIASYGQEGELAKAEEMLERARDAGLKADIITYNTLIAAYARIGRLAAASRVLEGMKEAGITPDAYTYNAFIKGYARSGLFADAERVIQHMRRVRCKPDAVTYNVLVDAYCKLCRFEEAWKFCEWVRRTDPDDSKALKLMERVTKLKSKL